MPSMQLSFTDFIDQFLKNMNMYIQIYFIKFYDGTYHVFFKIIMDG